MALFRDRARKRRRCPKCWYSMEGIAPLSRDEREVWRCPECGREQRHQRSFYWTRRRWGLAFAAMLVILAGYFTLKIPAIRTGGWPASIPSSILVFVAPPEFPRGAGVGAIIGGRSSNYVVTRDSSGNLVLTSPKGGAQRTANVPFELCAEAWNRFDNGVLAHWQARLLAKRFMSVQKNPSLAGCLAAPARWVAGRPIPLRLNPPMRNDWKHLGSLEIAGSELGSAPNTILAPVSAPDVSVVVELHGPYVGALIVEHVTLPCQVVDDLAKVFDPVDTPEATGLVRQALDIRIVHRGNDVAVVTDDRSDRAPWTSIEFGVGFMVDVLFDGKSVGHGASDVNWYYPVFKNWQELVRMTWEQDALQRVLHHPERARFIVTGSPAEVFEQYAKSPFDRGIPGAWTGMYESPVRVDSEWMHKREGAGTVRLLPNSSHATVTPLSR